MKKLVMAVAMVMGLVAFAGSSYQVYDVKFTGKSTKAVGSVTTECGETYNARDERNIKICGVLAGCGCAEAIANGTCDNAVAVFWNATDKKQITEFELTHELLQRIAKKANKVEEVATITFGGTNDEWQCEIVFAGFGKYTANKNDPELDVVKSVSGHFAGYMSAPLKKGTCSACSSTEDEATQAMAVCDCACTDSDTSNLTPYSGTYTIKYNGTKAKKCMNSGITAKNLGLPDYVGFVFGE